MSNNQYQGSVQSYDSICDQNVTVTARDGIKLATDIYFPAANETKAVSCTHLTLPTIYSV